MGLMSVSNWDWIVMSFAELLAVFAVDVNCQLLRKDTGIPQYVVWSICAEHAVSGFLVHIHTCCPIAVPIESCENVWQP